MKARPLQYFVNIDRTISQITETWDPSVCWHVTKLSDITAFTQLRSLRKIYVILVLFIQQCRMGLDSCLSQKKSYKLQTSNSMNNMPIEYWSLKHLAMYRYSENHKKMSRLDNELLGLPRQEKRWSNKFDDYSFSSLRTKSKYVWSSFKTVWVFQMTTFKHNDFLISIWNNGVTNNLSSSSHELRVQILEWEITTSGLPVIKFQIWFLSLTCWTFGGPRDY